MDVVIALANINNTSSYIDGDKKHALEVSAYLIEIGEFKRLYKEMQIHDLQKELGELDDEE